MCAHVCSCVASLQDLPPKQPRVFATISAAILQLRHLRPRHLRRDCGQCAGVSEWLPAGAHTSTGIVVFGRLHSSAKAAPTPSNTLRPPSPTPPAPCILPCLADATLASLEATALVAPLRPCPAPRERMRTTMAPPLLPIACPGEPAASCVASLAFSSLASLGVKSSASCHGPLHPSHSPAWLVFMC